MTAGGIEGRFHREMIAIYKSAKRECGYNPTRFLRMVTERDGLQAAKALLHSNALADGFMELWNRRRLDLTMEALVLRSPWKNLFTDEELATAEKRLRDTGYSP